MQNFYNFYITIRDWDSWQYIFLACLIVNGTVSATIIHDKIKPNKYNRPTENISTK